MTDLVNQEEHGDGGALARFENMPITTLLAKAIDKNLPVESMEKLVGLYERMADRQAAQEFAEAMADFQATCPPIGKNATARIATKKGGAYSFAYARLEDIARVVNPMLRERGLSYTWDSDESQGRIKTTCTVRHVNGHSISASFVAPTDTEAAMSGAQKNAAATTYARRQSLVQVLGLTTCDPDEDAVAPVSITPINEDQLATLECLIDDVGADRDRFVRHMGIPGLEHLPISRLQEAVDKLEAKRRSGA